MNTESQRCPYCGGDESKCNHLGWRSLRRGGSAASSALPPLPVNGGWQPIETAPKGWFVFSRLCRKLANRVAIGIALGNAGPVSAHILCISRMNSPPTGWRFGEHQNESTAHVSLAWMRHRSFLRGCGDARRHWFKLPLALRNEIWRAYRAGSGNHQEPVRRIFSGSKNRLRTGFGGKHESGGLTDRISWISLGSDLDAGHYGAADKCGNKAPMLCDCDCGGKTVARLSSLRSGTQFMWVFGKRARIRSDVREDEEASKITEEERIRRRRAFISQVVSESWRA